MHAEVHVENQHQINADNHKEVCSEAWRLVKADKGSRPLRRFLDRFLASDGTFIQVINEGLGFWPRQYAALTAFSKEKAPYAVDVFPDVEYISTEYDAKTGYIANIYKVADGYADFSLARLQSIMRCISQINVNFYGLYDNLNSHALRDCPDYEYRGLPCSSSPSGIHIGGLDVRSGGSGVLEWCVDEADATERLKLMKKHKRFEDVSISSLDDFVPPRSAK